MCLAGAILHHWQAGMSEEFGFATPGRAPSTVGFAVDTVASRGNHLPYRALFCRVEPSPLRDLVADLCLLSCSSLHPETMNPRRTAAVVHISFTRNLKDRLRATPVLLASALIIGCNDIPSAVNPVGPSAEVGPVAEPGNDFVVEDRFSLDVDVGGSLKPGQPIHLTLRGIANFATKDAEVRLSLPEVAAAEQSSWDLVEIPVGEETRPHIRLRRDFAAKAAFRERTTITIPKPGYYFVMATAKQYSDDVRTDFPNMVGDVSGKSFWLWIDEHGGRITETFDTTLFSPDMQKSRGPRSGKYKLPRIHKKGAQLACSVSPSDPPLLTVQGCPGDGETYPAPPSTSATHAFSVEYDRAGGGHVSAPVPGASYDFSVRTPSGELIASGKGNTDANGNIPVIDCRGSTGERNVQVNVFTANNKTRVVYGNESWPAGAYSGPCGGRSMITVNMYMAQAYVNMVNTAEGHYARFGQPIPVQIPVRLNEAGNTYYWYHVPEIHIYASYRMLFGEYGVLVSAHEWGHMWHDKYLIPPGERNGLMRYYDGKCVEKHPPASKSTLGCALGEGFADWYAVVVREAALPTWKDHLERNFYYDFCQIGAVDADGTAITCTSDGSVVQGAVHAFLWDLVDSSQGEAYDEVQFTPFQVADALRSCTVRLPGASQNTGNTGIDHLIYCMADRSPYRVTVDGTLRTFFDTRPQCAWPSSVLGSTLAIGSAGIRKSWIFNLYSKRVGKNPTISIEEDPAGEDPPPDPYPCADPQSLACQLQ